MKRFSQPVIYCVSQRFISVWSIRFFCALLILPALLLTVRAEENKSLRIATWGGAYEQAQQGAIFTPFTEKTGIPIITVPYNGGIEILKQAELPDLVSMSEPDALRACDEGLLQAIDYQAMVESATSGGRIADDFLPHTFRPCSVAHLTFSTVVAYNIEAFPATKPQTIEDFFDVEQFPGKRGLRKEPAAILEWALMARGVPLNQVYDLLSTERGLRLALEKLEIIREHIVWWDTADQPADLLKRGVVAMSSAYNGRIFAAQTQGVPLITLWNGQLVEVETWVIPGQVSNHLNIRPEIREFITFATTAQTQARMAEYIPYGPTRYSALKRIGKHPEYGLQMSGHLPTAPHHLTEALFKDSEWSANTAELRQEAFELWLQRGL